MAAQQNVEHRTSSKKTEHTKVVGNVNRFNEESAGSGIKSNLDCLSSNKNYENNNVNENNLSTASKNKKKEHIKVGDKNVEKNVVNNSLSKNIAQKQCCGASTETDSLSGSERLSKAKKRRLRKRKLQLASVSQNLSETVVNREGAFNSESSENIKKDDNVAVSDKESCKNVVALKSVNINGKDCNQCCVPFENYDKKLLTESITTSNNSPDYFVNVQAADSARPSVSDVNVNESLNKFINSDERKPKSEEQKITAHVFNDILLNIMQTLNTSNETCSSNQSDLTVGEQGGLDVKRANAESDLNLIDKIKEFSESFSKLESVEKLLNSSSFGEVSGDSVDGSTSKYKTEIKNLTEPLQVVDSSGMLQVDDKSNIVAEKTYSRKEDNCNTISLVNAKMDKDSVTTKQASKNTKSREEIVAEREAKKAAKLAAKKAKASGVKNVPEKSVDVVDGEVTLKRPLVPADVIIKDTDSEKSIVEKGLPISDIKSNLKENQEPKQIHAPKAESAGKTKAEIRAERREKQEAQRKAKAAQKEVVIKPQDHATLKTENVNVPSLPKRGALKDSEKKERKEITVEPKYKVKLFSHLYLEKDLFQDYDNIHPAVLQLGAQYEARVISGSNARCLALLHTLKRMVNDYSTPLKQEFSRGLESMLVKSMNYLNYCRPSSVSMTNAVRHIKRHLTQLPNTIPDSEARQKLYDIIDTYVREQIDVAGEAICNTVQKKINNGDVILTYGCSSLIYRILLESHKSGTKFSVVVVDGGPWFEGREMLRRLVREGLRCSYILITATSFIMREASKVLLGAHALLANGYVMSRAGTSQVALLAHSNNVPVLVCCETHKFSERVQTDAFVYNELGDPDKFISSTKPEWRSYDYLTPLSIAFDVTPPDLVTAVVTELGILPCTSVPVILRIKPSEAV